MYLKHIQTPASAAARQRGQAALIAVLLLFGVGATVLVYLMATPTKISIENDRKTAAALARAKEALIGYAAENPNQPGILPCPDTNNDGSADSPCGVTGVTVVGRLPWKTLGLPDLRDGAGECLWYVVSANFKNSGASGPSTLNSGSTGTLVVNDASGNPIYSGSNAALAIVFAPGVVLPGQDRSPSSTTICGGNTTAANYLEGGNQNGASTNIFVSSQATTTFNDNLLPITRDAVFPTVEMRVARELRLSLQNYYTANQYYPYAAPFPGFTATPATYRGYVPTAATPVCAPPTPDLSPYLPGWFTTNNWQQFMVYAVAPRCTAKIEFNVSLTIALLAPPPPCATSCINLVLVQVCLLSQAVDSTALNCNNTSDGSPAGSWLTVSGAGNMRSIVLPASYRLGTQTRPCNSISDCLETVGTDIENIDGIDNYVYVKPVRSSTNNDNLIVVAP